MELKNHIRQHRARMNFTQQDLAEKTHVSRQTISSIEKGKFIPSTLLSLKIARALEMKVDTLFELTEDSKREDKQEIKEESFIDKIQRSRFNE